MRSRPVGGRLDEHHRFCGWLTPAPRARRPTSPDRSGPPGKTGGTGPAGATGPAGQAALALAAWSTGIAAASSGPTSLTVSANKKTGALAPATLTLDGDSTGYPQLDNIRTEAVPVSSYR